MSVSLHYTGLQRAYKDRPKITVNSFQIGGEAREYKGPRTFLGLLTEARGREPHLALSLG